jgi:hypothetical protein
VAPSAAVASAAATGAGASVDAVAVLRLRIEQAAADERLDLLRDFVRTHVMRVLRRPDDDPPGFHGRLMDLGVDSLMAVKLRAQLGEGLGLSDPLPATLMFDHPTIAGLADVLAARFDDVAAAPPVFAEPRHDGIAPPRALDIGAIAALSEAEIEALVIRQMQNEAAS